MPVDLCDMTSMGTNDGNIWGDQFPQLDVLARLGRSHLFHFISIDPIPLILPTTI